MSEQRDGEIALPVDPAGMAADAGLIFIGRVRSPWPTSADCPKNLRAAREIEHRAHVEIDEAYRAGLKGLTEASHVILLSWFDRAERNLIVQKPRHATKTTGVFALRSPVRPNPIGLHVVKLLALDIEAGRLDIDAIDLLNGTPILDVKPYFPSVDAFPDAVRPKS
jgi:tRNA (adenine37-N6)-methyltransferase